MIHMLYTNTIKFKVKISFGILAIRRGRVCGSILLPLIKFQKLPFKYELSDLYICVYEVSLRYVRNCKLYAEFYIIYDCSYH